MTSRTNIRRTSLGTAFAALAIGLGTLAPIPAAAKPGPGTYRPTNQVLLSEGQGQMVNLPRSVTDVWTSNPGVADVHVVNPRQVSIFGKAFGDATIIATAADGSVVYGANLHVNPNLGNINEALRAAMPDSNVTVTTIGQMAVLNGTVASPEDATFAEGLVRSTLNAGLKADEPLKMMPVNRLKVATPLQVTLKVKIAEVSRDLLKQVGVNLLGIGNDFVLQQGEGIFVPKVGEVPDPGKDATGQIIRAVTGTTLGLSKNIFGLDLISRLQLSEADGLVTTLAEPNLTALSGETASFLAGGEFPIPVSQSLGSISIEYKQYGVGLAFTPIVLADGRISMRVRPEVSELSDAGSVRMNDFVIPALTTRRAETTVELGSGQSFMIAGLLRNSSNNNIDKAPFLGDLPILGALFRSTKYRRQETELVIIVTPYLVRPVSVPSRMASPTDGYRAPTDPEMVLEGQTYKGVSGRPPIAAAPGPAVGAAGAAAAPGFKL